MASTGAYRQALQQIFAISIEDELSQQLSNDSPLNNIGQDEFGPLQNFEESGKNETITKTNTNNNIQNNEKAETNEITDDYLDKEFAEFLDVG